MYHFVCPAKYRRVVFSEEVDKTLKEVCIEISLVEYIDPFTGEPVKKGK